ncbi:hypothetical protein A1351_20405 [Methylosinus sp. R-45379]|nr:hypothetical protein A1351_20405 [Methylosinus sp. R-45379]
MLAAEEDDFAGVADPCDARRRAAGADLEALIVSLAPGPDDAICFPSVDFYSLEGLVQNIEALKRAGNPKIMLRFIGVMENAAHGFADPLCVALANVRILIANGLNVRLSAETPRYAEMLAVALDAEVVVTPSIEHGSILPLPRHDFIHVICPGSARADKGFFDLESIFSHVRQRDPDLRVRFTTQVLPDKDIVHQQVYHAKLYALPGVTVLPTSVSAEEMAGLYASCDLVLLPYEKETYQFRGSAVLAEAVAYGRPVLTLEGTAFADQVRFFSIGDVLASRSELVEAILSFGATSRATRVARARHARRRYLSDLTSNYRGWVN